MERSKIINLFAIGLIIIAIFFLISQRTEKTITANIIKENLEIAEQQNSVLINPEKLTSIVKEIVQSNYPESKGAFIMTDEKLSHCIMSKPCSAWHYPYEGPLKNRIYSSVYYFDGMAPTTEEIIETNQSKDMSKNHVSNKEVIFLETMEEYGDTELKSFEVNIPCQNRYWIKVGFKQIGSKEFLEKGPILQIADEVIKRCNQ